MFRVYVPMWVDLYMNRGSRKLQRPVFSFDVTAVLMSKNQGSFNNSSCENAMMRTNF